MQIIELAISGIKLITPRVFRDVRGCFIEIYNSESLEKIGIRDVFVQDNMSLSVHAGTIRGLHFQDPPYAQSKLVRVSQGRILDVAIDIRPHSATYGQHVSTELTAQNGVQIYIPHGFAHGFCTLEDNTEVIYKVSCHYAPHAERGILWCDPGLNIDWPVNQQKAIVSDKDKNLPLLKELTLAV